MTIFGFKLKSGNEVSVDFKDKSTVFSIFKTNKPSKQQLKDYLADEKAKPKSKDTKKK